MLLLEDYSKTQKVTVRADITQRRMVKEMRKKNEGGGKAMGMRVRDVRFVGSV